MQIKNNPYLKAARWMLFSLFIFTQAFGQVKEINATKIPAHPRLLLLAGQEEGIKKSIANSPYWNHINNAIIEESNTIVALPPLQRVLIGRRLLATSRESFRRIFYLSYAWRMTHDKKYLNKCEEEMLAVSKFSDWNPSHFLDVAEMTMGVSIGYDWLYNDLSPSVKAIIGKAIITKGINPSLDPKYNDWLGRTNNWNQVCNAGITFGALAVYEDQPKLSAQLIDRAVKSIPLAMNGYKPDGTYTEGYNYWSYGTSFNVLFLDALQQVFGTDYGLSNTSGFRETARFFENLTGPTGICFDYSDGPEAPEFKLQPAMFWFADKFQNKSLLWQEKENILLLSPDVTQCRILPAIMLWGKGIDPQNITPPANKVFISKGENPVALMRTSWNNPSAIYIGFKGGSPSASHAHMDVGSFVMDADGVRWSMDLGYQDYTPLELKGIDLWNMNQNSPRWQIFRYSNFSHSTLTVNGHLQNVKGKAVFIASKTDPMFTSAVLDMTDMYKRDLTKAKRGIAIVNKQYVLVRDEVETGDSVCVVRWVMTTRATIAQKSGNQMQLLNNGKKLTLIVAGVPHVVLKTWSANPPHSYDDPNPGISLVGFEIKLPAHTKQVFKVLLVPGERQIKAGKTLLKPLSEW